MMKLALAETADPRLMMALAWRDALAEVSRLQKAEGLSQNAACARLGLNPGTVSKKRRALAAGGLEALRDRRAEASGRLPAVSFDADEARRLRWHVLRKDSLRLALEACLAENAFTPDTAALIKGYLERARTDRKPLAPPPSVRRAAKTTREERAAFRGKKKVQDAEAYERRRPTAWCPVRQCEVPLGARDLFASDDVSLNQPFRFFDAGTGQWKVGRQCLATMASIPLRWLGMTPLGREKDAYRDEDKLDHMLEVADACGMPLVWRLEQGWSTQALDGVDLAKVLKNEALKGQRWGTLPFQIDYVFRSRSKGEIEGAFDHLQALEAHELGRVDLGRVRGEFDAGTKLLRQAQEAQEKALVWYPELAWRADFLAGSAARFNAEAKVRACFGGQMLVPDDLWEGSARRELPASERWRFLPVKKLATASRGAVEARAAHYPAAFRFRLNGQGAYRDGQGYIPDGYKVLIAFHPAHPELGCLVASAELGPLNREGVRLGAVLCQAPHWTEVPQIILGGGPPPEHLRGQAAKANAAVRREYREIAAAGKKAAAASTAQDGQGRVYVLRQGAPGTPLLPPQGAALPHSPQRESAPSRAGRLPQSAPDDTPEPDLDALAAAEAALLAGELTL